MSDLMEAVDGRNARRVRNRQAVVDATLSLLDEGHTDISVDEVVERSGVSKRSIFRYFETLDDLRSAVIARNFERARPILSRSGPVGAPLAERVAALLDARFELYALLAGPARLARPHIRQVPSVAADFRRYQDLLERQTRAYVGTELERLGPDGSADALAAIEIVLALDAMERLADHGHDPAAIRRIWTHALLRLLAPAAP